MIPTWVMIAALVSAGPEPVPAGLDGLPALQKVPGPTVQIPYRTDGLEAGSRIQFYVSSDRGKTWELQEESGPDKKVFTLRATKPGEYWYTARVKKKDGTLEPADVSELVPMYRVAVATGISAPETPVKAKPTAAEMANDLDDELTRVELELIRKELKRLSEMSELTPAAEDKLDRLRIRLRDLRDRLGRDSSPTANPPATSRSPSVLPPAIPSRDGDLIPATNLPVAPLPRTPGRP